MFIRRKQKLNKLGFTLAETVLALAVISISSVGLLSLVLSSHRATINAAQKQQAQLYAMDIINCYRVSDTYQNFEKNLEFTLGFADKALNTLLQDNEETITLKNMQATISINANNTLTVYIQNDTKNLTDEIKFTKGVALTNEETP